MKKIIVEIGALLLFFGIASSILFFFHMELELLMWIDMRWNEVAWAIRWWLVGIGLLLVIMGKVSTWDQEIQAPSQPSAPSWQSQTSHDEASDMLDDTAETKNV